MHDQSKYALCRLKLLWLFRLALILGAACLLTGCSFDPFGAKQEVQEVRTSTAEDMKIVRGDFRRIEEELNNLSARLDRSSTAHEREIASLKSTVTGLERQLSQTNVSVLSEVDKKIADSETRRVADKNELVGKINSIVDQVNALSRRVRAAASAPPGGVGKVTQEGFYYTVQEGDTLWGIVGKFREYGVTVEAIRQANKVGPGDRIVTGQKLFIPAKEK